MSTFYYVQCIDCRVESRPAFAPSKDGHACVTVWTDEIPQFLFDHENHQLRCVSEILTGDFHIDGIGAAR